MNDVGADEVELMTNSTSVAQRQRRGKQSHRSNTDEVVGNVRLYD